MVDFATERVIGVQRLAKRMEVSSDTIRRWFRQGLEKVKVGGKVYTSLEAVNRFSQPVSFAPLPTADPQHAEALRELRARGINIGSEALKDGRQKAKVGAA